VIGTLVGGLRSRPTDSSISHVWRTPVQGIVLAFLAEARSHRRRGKEVGPRGGGPNHRRPAGPAARQGCGRIAACSIPEALAPSPGQAGLCRRPLVRRRPARARAEHLRGVDVAIVGAPTDDLVSDRRARASRRARSGARPATGPHLEAHVDAFAELRIVDYGDAPVIPADPAASHGAIEQIVGEVVDAGALPLILGGDHSITEPCVSAIAQRRVPSG